LNSQQQAYSNSETQLFSHEAPEGYILVLNVMLITSQPRCLQSALQFYTKLLRMDL